MASALQSQMDEAFALCKAQAAVDGAFAEPLLRFWFQSAWDVCSAMAGFEPPQSIKEPICIDDCGNFTLSHWPTSEVQIIAGYRVVATFPPSLKRSRCDPALCCYCNLHAEYMIGRQTCEVSPRFLQAVARLFTYMVENRGDSEMDEHILAKSGAMLFLSPDVTYVL